MYVELLSVFCSSIQKLSRPISDNNLLELLFDLLLYIIYGQKTVILSLTMIIHFTAVKSLDIQVRHYG